MIVHIVFLMRQGARKPRKKATPAWTVILKALADESRLRIISALLRQETAVQDLSDTLDMKIYNISKHLKILEGAGLIEKQKDGNHRIYRITPAVRSRLSSDNQALDLGCCKFIFDGSEK
ncbi:MAG: ArsR family transcriptional regulator [Nitrospiraceae bacterium]|nr:MAG: ArsR family transcriptional regulator [Nitrospiraceae bacterium]